jgi:hypothetical protein
MSPESFESLCSRIPTRKDSEEGHAPCQATEEQDHPQRSEAKLA